VQIANGSQAHCLLPVSVRHFLGEGWSNMHAQ